MIFKGLLGAAIGNPWALAIAAAVLLSLGAAGGWKVASWRAAEKVAAAKQELADYQLQAAAVITQRLEADARRTAEDLARVNDISIAVEEGKRETERGFKPVLEELGALRTAAAVWRLRDDEASRDRGAGAPAPQGSCERRADACEERLRGARAAFGEVVAAAEEVARAGADAGAQHKQLIGAIAHIQEVCK